MDSLKVIGAVNWIFLLAAHLMYARNDKTLSKGGNEIEIRKHCKCGKRWA